MVSEVNRTVVEVRIKFRRCVDQDPIDKQRVLFFFFELKGKVELLIRCLRIFVDPVTVMNVNCLIGSKADMLVHRVLHFDSWKINDVFVPGCCVIIGRSESVFYCPSCRSGVH